MSHRSHRRPVSQLLILTIVGLLSLLLAACGKAPASTPDVFVIVSSATANEPAPELAADNRNMLENAGTTSTQADAYVLDPATGQPTEVPLTPRRPDGQVEYGPRRDGLLGQNVNRVEQLLPVEAATGPFDLLGLIASAVRVTSPPGTLLILSSGLSTAGGFDLRQVGWDADPSSIAAQLKHQGLLPSLTGWQVIFSGLGGTAGAQPALPLPQRTTLAAYWTAICRAAGAASCRVDETTRPDPPSRSSVPVPVVPVPAVQSVRGPRGTTSVSVPNDQLFAFNSASLLPGANGILGPLAARARSAHLLASITGYASPDGGSDAYNLALSRARAVAVRGRLVALGLPPAQIAHVAGLGTDGKTSQACDIGGQVDEVVCAQFRRVVVLLTPPPAASS
ncbi:MAG: OmpA family protein [Streptosporangiaceae bacterium]|jgi:outer membrane protein OmpA-like peptidoglycan-associated protein